MFFWILLFAPVLFLAMPVAAFRVDGDALDKLLFFFLSSIICVPLALICFSAAYSSWDGYTTTYAKVVAQSEVIAVYEERVTSLKATLNEINYPSKSEISLDADTPWASLVASLTQAEKDLAEAKKVRAEALRDIEAWKRGPMSGVVTFVGEPESD